MSTENEWERHIARASHIRDGITPNSLQWHGAANDISKMMINVLFIIHGGGLAAIPALKAIDSKIPVESLAKPAMFFFVGLALALLCGIFTIANYRLLGNALEAHMRAQLNENIEQFKATQQGTKFTPSDSLVKEQATADRYGKVAIPVTFYFGWGFGLASAIVFVIGGVTLGGELNPVCSLFGSWCPTGH